MPYLAFLIFKSRLEKGESFMNIKFTNVCACKVNPSTTLRPEEIAVVEEIVHFMLSKFVHADCGKFALFGKKKQMDASCILRFNISGEDQTYESEEFLTRANIFVAESLAMAEHDIMNKHLLKTRVYATLQNKALILNCTGGQFLCSCYANFRGNGHIASSLVLLAVAKTLANLCKEDDVLQESWGLLRAEYQSLSIYEYERIIDNLFEKAELPALKTWKKWSEDDSPIFFSQGR